jgi:predicted transglutaminase-like cysteine proteinase
MRLFGILRGKCIFFSLFGIFLLQWSSPVSSYARIVRTEGGVLIAESELITQSLPPLVFKQPKKNKINDMLFRNRIKSIDSYAKWLKREIKYVNDSKNVDQWANAYETLEKKSGDCEDLAFLTKKVLTDLGYKVKVLAVARTDQDTHAFSLVDLNGRIAIFDNTDLVYTKAKTFGEITQYFSKKLTTKYILELDEPIRDDRYVKILYSKS